MKAAIIVSSSQSCVLYYISDFCILCDQYAIKCQNSLFINYKMIIITAVFEVSHLMQIYLLKLKWASNEALVNLILSVLKVSFAMSVNTKNDFYFSFFAFLISSCKSVTILK